MSFHQAALHNFKTFIDSMQLLVKLKLLRFTVGFATYILTINAA